MRGLRRPQDKRIIVIVTSSRQRAVTPLSSACQSRQLRVFREEFRIFDTKWCEIRVSSRKVRAVPYRPRRTSAAVSGAAMPLLD